MLLPTERVGQFAPFRPGRPRAHWEASAVTWARRRPTRRRSALGSARRGRWTLQAGEANHRADEFPTDLPSAGEVNDRTVEGSGNVGAVLAAEDDQVNVGHIRSDESHTLHHVILPEIGGPPARLQVQRPEPFPVLQRRRA